VPELMAAIDRFREHSAAAQGSRRRARAEWRLRELVAQRFVRHLESQVLGPGELEMVLGRIAARQIDPYTLADDLLNRALGSRLSHSAIGSRQWTSRNRQSSLDNPQSGVFPAVALDHIGIAVAKLEEALTFYRDGLGMAIEPPEEVASQRVRAHFIPAGEAALELLEATADDSPIAKYVAKRGPGLHHITLRVEDIRAALAQLASRGVRLIDESPRTGAHGSLVAFIHPSSTHGVLVELKQVV
jgi:methylmalonyl-CoA/ethylmalonyl-CoA epimerase